MTVRIRCSDYATPLYPSRLALSPRMQHILRETRCTYLQRLLDIKVDLNRQSFHVIFQVLTVVNMKNAAFWDMKTHSVPHRRHITSTLHSPAG
jgi:hypothetical protein